MRVFLLWLMSWSISYGQFIESPYSLSTEGNVISPERGSDIQVLSTELRVAVPLVLKDNLIVAASLSYEQQFFEGGYFVDDLSEFGFTLFSRWKFKKDWATLTIASIASSYEAGGDFSEALNYTGLAGLRYRGIDKLTIGGGFGFTLDIDDDFSLFPILLLDWQFSDKWSLTTAPTPGSRFGPGLSLEYEHNDRLAFYLGTRYVSDEYLLGDGEIYSYDTVRAFVTGQYRFSNGFSLNATAGMNLWGEVELERTGLEIDLDPSPFVALNFSWDF